MTCSRFVAALAITSLAKTSSAIDDVQHVHHANHIFNAVHSSMRQWGSSLNHNGMSLFLATVPEGTQLYHGTPKENAVKGMDWLAFEPEHALIFARPRGALRPLHEHGLSEVHPDGEFARDESWKSVWRSGPPSRESSDGPRSGKSIAEERASNAKEARVDWSDEARLSQAYAVRPPHHTDDFSSHFAPPDFDKRPRTPNGRTRKSPLFQHGRINEQQPFTRHQSEQDDRFGYLHTYVPKHDLQLLYIDGLSAGKSNIGTLDTQDLLLLNGTISNPMGPIAEERERATGLCDLAKSIWKKKIDGFLRMEGGFEIILCDFQKHLERTDVVGIGAGRTDNGGFLGGWQYLKAITSRYDGIGGGRVRLYYDHFVSIFAYPGLKDLFCNDVRSNYPMPRLQNISQTDLATIREDVTAMILQRGGSGNADGVTWRSVTDMVVRRYSAPLHFLHTNEKLRHDSVALTEYLWPILLPYIDRRQRNTTSELERCVAHLVPELRSEATLAHRTVYAVTHRICDTLFTALSIASTTASHSVGSSARARPAIDAVHELVEYLQWTSWKECGTCADEEICYIPIWPMGTIEDHASPRCRNKETAGNRFGYWGPMGPRRPPPPPSSTLSKERDQSTMLDS